MARLNRSHHHHPLTNLLATIYALLALKYGIIIWEETRKKQPEDRLAYSIITTLFLMTSWALISPYN